VDLQNFVFPGTPLPRNAQAARISLDSESAAGAVESPRAAVGPEEGKI